MVEISLADYIIQRLIHDHDFPWTDNIMENLSPLVERKGQISLRETNEPWPNHHHIPPGNR